MNQAVVRNLAEFMIGCSSTAYAEPQSELHTALAKEMWARVKLKMNLPEQAQILDLGCGSGFCMEMFTDEGHVAVGLSVMEEEIRAINDRGVGSAAFLDMHEIGCFQNYFHLVWARHVLEHSPCPMFVLSQIHQALKPWGYVYVEVPGSMEDGSTSLHETNPSHFSVMGPAMWANLLLRCGFVILDQGEIKFATALGPDIYHFFLAQVVVSD